MHGNVPVVDNSTTISSMDVMIIDITQSIKQKECLTSLHHTCTHDRYISSNIGCTQLDSNLGSQNVCSSSRMHKNVPLVDDSIATTISSMDDVINGTTILHSP